MKVTYEKTDYEIFIDILETAFLARRPIKSISMYYNEWKSIEESIANVKFINALGRKVFIKTYNNYAELGAEPYKATVTYQVVESPSQYTATLNHVLVEIL